MRGCGSKMVLRFFYFFFVLALSFLICLGRRNGCFGGKEGSLLWKMEMEVWGVNKWLFKYLKKNTPITFPSQYEIKKFLIVEVIHLNCLSLGFIPPNGANGALWEYGYGCYPLNSGIARNVCTPGVWYWVRDKITDSWKWEKPMTLIWIIASSMLKFRLANECLFSNWNFNHFQITSRHLAFALNAESFSHMYIYSSKEREGELGLR